MLPNHAPLVIAEQFGTLDALFPAVSTSGSARAPGSDQKVSRAIRRTLDSDPNAFPREVLELQSYFADTRDSGGPTGIRAIPGAGADVKLWILGSSLFGAQLAAALGLPLCLRLALRAGSARCRDRDLAAQLPAFRRPRSAVPHARLQRVRRRQRRRGRAARQLATAGLCRDPHRRGHPAAPAVRGYRESLGAQGAAMLDQVLSASAIGGPATVAREIAAFVAHTGTDELMIASAMYDHDARKRSLAITAEAMRGLTVAA